MAEGWTHSVRCR